MSPSLQTVARALSTDPAYTDAEVFAKYEPHLPDLFEAISRLGYMDDLVTPEGVCLVHAEFIDSMIKKDPPSDRRTVLEHQALVLRAFVANRTELIGEMTDEQIFIAKESPLNQAAKALFQSGLLTFAGLLHINPGALLPTIH